VTTGSPKLIDIKHVTDHLLINGNFIVIAAHSAMQVTKRHPFKRDKSYQSAIMTTLLSIQLWRCDKALDFDPSVIFPTA
jgi:hypothetical protein